MKERVNYEMTEADLKKLIEASKPTPCMMIGSYVTPTPQENANMAWAKLGKKMGFDPMTVQPIPGKSERFFSAVPVEGEEAIKEKDFFFHLWLWTDTGRRLLLQDKNGKKYE